MSMGFYQHGSEHNQCGRFVQKRCKHLNFILARRGVLGLDDELEKKIFVMNYFFFK